MIPIPPLARRLLVASLVALHAAVMLCGPCLHGLPGMGHTAVATLGADVDHGRDPVKAPHAQGDDCPVCHFFSQGQLPVDTACVPAAQDVYVWRHDTPYASAVVDRLHPTSPRAPPLVSARFA